MLGCFKFPAALLAAAAFAVILAPANGAVAKPRCSGTPSEPQVTLQTNPGKIVYDTSRSRAQIKRLKSVGGGVGRKRGWHPIGLTVSELKFQMEISVNVLSRSDTLHCATVNEVRAQLGFDQITVYVDKRYRKGSCPYRSILDHEHEHVNIFRNALAHYAPKVEARLTEAAARLKPVSARSVNRAAEKLQKALHRKMKSMFKTINATMDANNARIDTVDNYKREQARCTTW